MINHRPNKFNHTSINKSIGLIKELQCKIIWNYTKCFLKYFEAILTTLSVNRKGQGKVVLPPLIHHLKRALTPWKKSFIESNSFQDSFLFEKFHPIILKLWCSAREIGKISAIFQWNCKQTRRIDEIIRWWFNLTTRYCHLHSIQSNIYNQSI